MFQRVWHGHLDVHDLDCLDEVDCWDHGLGHHWAVVRSSGIWLVCVLGREGGAVCVWGGGGHSA